MSEQELIDLLTMRFQREVEREFIVIAGSKAPPLLPRLAKECLRQMEWAASEAYRQALEWEGLAGKDPRAHFTIGLAPENWKI